MIVSKNFRDPLDGNPGSLLHGKWVVGRLELDERAYSVVAQMCARFEVLRARVKRQFSRKPSEKWTDVRSLRRIEASRELIETVLAERNPDSPGERLRFTLHGNFQTTQNIELLPVDHTGVAVQQTSDMSLLGRYPIMSVTGMRSPPRHREVRLRYSLA